MLVFVRLGAVLILGCLATRLAAQVGHDPESSPYHRLDVSQTITFVGGYLSGGRGLAGVAPSGGVLGGARWDIRVGDPTTAFLGVSLANLERRLIDPDQPEESRLIGEANQSVVLLDGGFNVILTGAKTWHGFAPYAGLGLGVALGGSVPEDSSGFTFNTKFQLGPSVGLRLFFGNTLHLRAEARDILWRVNYPSRFFQPPASDPDAPPLLDPNTQGNAQWVHHPTIIFAVGYTLKR